LYSGKTYYGGSSWSDKYVADCLRAVRDGEKHNRLILLAETCDLAYSQTGDSPILDTLYEKLLSGESVTYYEWQHVYLPEIREQAMQIEDVLWIKDRYHTLFQTINIHVDRALTVYYDIFRQAWFAFVTTTAEDGSLSRSESFGPYENIAEVVDGTEWRRCGYRRQLV